MVKLNCFFFIIAIFWHSYFNSSAKKSKWNYQSFACRNNSDCSFLGICNTTSNKCNCYFGWYGDNCGYLNLSSKFNNNFYKTDGYHNIDGLSSWDGSVIFDSSNNKWHLFNSILTNNCGPNEWLSNSYVAHLISNNSNIIGPYYFNDIALNVYNNYKNISNNWDGLSVFNPSIILSNNIYYLFYTGTSAAYSNSLYGPWKRFINNPILNVLNNVSPNR